MHTFWMCWFVVNRSQGWHQVNLPLHMISSPSPPCTFLLLPSCSPHVLPPTLLPHGHHEYVFPCNYCWAIIKMNIIITDSTAGQRLQERLLCCWPWSGVAVWSLIWPISPCVPLLVCLCPRFTSCSNRIYASRGLDKEQEDETAERRILFLISVFTSVSSPTLARWCWVVVPVPRVSRAAEPLF